MTSRAEKLREKRPFGEQVGKLLIGLGQDPKIIQALCKVELEHRWAEKAFKQVEEETVRKCLEIVRKHSVLREVWGVTTKREIAEAIQSHFKEKE